MSATVLQSGPFANGDERRLVRELAGRLSPEDVIVTGCDIRWYIDRGGRRHQIFGEIDAIVLRGDAVVAIERKSTPVRAPIRRAGVDPAQALSGKLAALKRLVDDRREGHRVVSGVVVLGDRSFELDGRRALAAGQPDPVITWKGEALDHVARIQGGAPPADRERLLEALGARRDARRVPHHRLLEPVYRDEVSTAYRGEFELTGSPMHIRLIDAWASDGRLAASWQRAWTTRIDRAWQCLGEIGGVLVPLPRPPASTLGELAIVAPWRHDLPLGAQIAEQGRLAPGPVVRLLGELSQTLDAVANTGARLRHISPHAVLAQPDGSVLVMAVEWFHAHGVVTMMDAATTFVRRSPWMAPEIRASPKAHPASADRYCVAALATVALTGLAPPIDGQPSLAGYALGDRTRELLERELRADRPRLTSAELVRRLADALTTDGAAL